MTTTTLKRLTWDQIHASPNNLRKDVGDIGDLAESIAGLGLLQPMVVRKNEDGYELVAGERRWTAIGMLIRDGRVPAEQQWDTLVRTDMDDPHQTAAMIVENLHRSGLTPVEELAGILRLQNEHSWTPAEIALQTGIPASTVKARLKWAKLPDHVINAIGDKLTVGDANKLASFPAEAVMTLTKAHKVPGSYEISEYERRAEKERSLNRIRKLLEGKGHLVINKGEWATINRVPIGTHDVVALTPAIKKLAKLAKQAEKDDDLSIETEWVSTDKDQLDAYLVDVKAGDLFILDAQYSVTLSHVKVVKEDTEDEQALTDYDRAQQAAEADYEKARAEFDGQRRDAIAQFLEGKPSEVVLWCLGNQLRRESYMIEQDEPKLRAILNLGENDPELKVWSVKSAANMAKTIAGSSFMQRYSDPPNCPPRPERVDVDENAYDEEGTFIPEDQRPVPELEGGGCACGDPEHAGLDHGEDECTPNADFVEAEQGMPPNEISYQDDEPTERTPNEDPTIPCIGCESVPTPWRTSDGYAICETCVTVLEGDGVIEVPEPVAGD